jgi:hypothetical protein
VIQAVQVEIELRYGFPDGLDFAPEELAAFARLNGVFNAWPYFREFLQSATTRMGLPQFVLPVFRVRKAPNPRVRCPRAFSPQDSVPAVALRVQTMARWPA